MSDSEPDDGSRLVEMLVGRTTSIGFAIFLYIDRVQIGLFYDSPRYGDQSTEPGQPLTQCASEVDTAVQLETDTR